jgi:ribosome-associated toxin RatA of RatAB toxin-antitoxin module
MPLLTFRKTASLDLPCDPALPFDILTDYDAYSEWMPFYSQSKLLAREGDLAIAEFGLRPRGGEKFAVECIHTRNRMVLVRTISGRVPVTQFKWTIGTIAPAQNGCQVSLAIDGKAGWQRLLPAFRQLVRPRECLKALEKQAASFSPDLKMTDAGGETLFEIAETAQGLICSVRGKKYRLTPLSEGPND